MLCRPSSLVVTSARAVRGSQRTSTSAQTSTAQTGKSASAMSDIELTACERQAIDAVNKLSAGQITEEQFLRWLRSWAAWRVAISTRRMGYEVKGDQYSVLAKMVKGCPDIFSHEGSADLDETEDVDGSD